MQLKLAFILTAVYLSSSALAYTPEISGLITPGSPESFGAPQAHFKIRDETPAIGLGDSSSSDPAALLKGAAAPVAGLAVDQVKGTVAGYLGTVGTGVKTAKQLQAFLPTGAIAGPLSGAAGSLPLAGALPVKREDTPALGLGDASSNDPTALVKGAAGPVAGIATDQLKGTVQGYLGTVGTGVRTAKQAQAFLPVGALAGPLSGASSSLPLAGALPVKRDGNPLEQVTGQAVNIKQVGPNDLVADVKAAPEMVKGDAAQIVAEGSNMAASTQQTIQDLPANVKASTDRVQAGLAFASKMSSEGLQSSNQLAQGGFQSTPIPGKKPTTENFSERNFIVPAVSLFPGSGPKANELKHKVQDLIGQGQGGSGSGLPLGKRMHKVKRSN